MTLSWKPTPGNTYRVYEIVNGVRKRIGSVTGGRFTLDNSKITRGTHDYVVTAVDSEGRESLPSKELFFTKRKR